MSGTIQISVYAVIILTTVCMIGCGGGSTTLNPAPGETPMAESPGLSLGDGAFDSVFQVRMRPQEPQEFPGRSISWVNPIQLGNLLPKPDKLISADEELKKEASAYETALPNQHVSAAIPPYALFSPGWTAGSQGTGDLAYAMYRFSLDGYEVLPEETLGYAWDTPPADYANLWIGLGDTDTNAWDWFAGDADGVITIEDTGKYIDDVTDNLLLAVVLLGTDECVLTELRLGVHELRGTGGFASVPDGASTQSTRASLGLTASAPEWDRERRPACVSPRFDP